MSRSSSSTAPIRPGCDDGTSAEAALSADELESIGALIDEAVAVDALHNLPNQDDAFIHLAEHPILFPIIHGIMSDDVALSNHTIGVNSSVFPSQG